MESSANAGRPLPPVDDKLIVAIPSKGRIMDEAVAVFSKAGLVVRKSGNERGYRGLIDGVPDAEVAFLSSSEIATEVGAGRAHIGITGLDLVHEYVPSWAERIEILKPLGFGHANVILAVPRSWLDVSSVADLESVGLAFRRVHGRRPRVATKFVNLTRRFLAIHGVTSYLVVESLGATEGTPAAGTAEIVVDITETGATIQANHLKVLSDDVLLASQACLIRSRNAPWTAAAMAALDTIMDRIGGAT